MKMLPYSNFTAEEIDGYIRSVKPEQVKRSLSQAEHKFTDFLHFISPAAADLLPEMTEVSARIKRRHFGNTVRTFAPLYISSYCMNNCVYCGFRKSYDYPRRRLSFDEVLNEARIIRDMGHESLLLITGEDAKISPDFTADLIRVLKNDFAYINIEYYPMTEPSYRKLYEAGCHGLTIFQETYDPELYPSFHPSGPKANYQFRLNALAEGGKAGFYNLGMGALLGLNPNWRLEASNMAVHGLWIRKHFWKSHPQFSFPRITPTKWGYNVPAPLSDHDLEQMILAFRLAFHEADLILSTREKPEFRLRMAESAVSHLSACSQVDPGGYQDHLDGKNLGQFSMNDQSSVEQVCAGIRRHGMVPVFKDWDRSFQ